MRKVNLIPMAGDGRRFREAGYDTPKPLIPIGGAPMVVRAAKSLPPADHWIFVCRAEHLAHSPLAAVLAQEFKPAQIISLAEPTQGQACTCLMAESALQADDCLTIGACDNAMTYSQEAWARAMADDSVDALIWTFRHNPAVLQNPRMYGWVDADAHDRVRRVSCKVPLSETPMEDHAVIGAFTFKRAADFIRQARHLIATERRIHNEFYVDETINVAVENGLRVKVFEVNSYIGWGTPRDVDVYRYWRAYFQQTGME